MKWHIVNIVPIFKESFLDFLDNKAFRMSAALAYYTVFSIAPMLIVIISLCNIFYGKATIEAAIFQHIQAFIGQYAASEIERTLQRVTIAKTTTWASVIGICALIFAATGVFAEIQDSINFIWRLKAKPKKSWLKLIVNRVLSFSMVVSLGFILLVSLVISSVLDLAGQQLINLFPGMAVYVAYGINLFLTFITISCLFAIIFKVLPDARILWREVIIGSVTTSVLFMLGKFAIAYYLNKTEISTTYGAAGAVVIILLWVYYSAIILYFGACFTRIYAKRTGRDIYPNEYAVWIQEIELENTASIQVQENAPSASPSVPVAAPENE